MNPRKHIKRWLREERGQAITEFALVIPVLLMVLMGVFEIGRICHAYLVVTEAARDAVRYVSVGDEDQVGEVVQADTTTLDQKTSKVTVTITPSDPADRLPGQAVTVNVSYSVQLITPVLDKIFPNPTTVQSTISMRKE